MTPKKTEQLRTKIAGIKRTLAAEKQKFGGYDDSCGLRYLPVKYFIQLGDYKGGLAYLKWFSKNFPDDAGFPDFLFEWTIILFKNGKAEEGAQKAFEAFCANTYLFDRFFNRPVTPIDKRDSSDMETPGFADYLDYSSSQAELSDFGEWLDNLITTVAFKSRCDRYIDIQKKLSTENDPGKRGYLIRQARQLKETKWKDKPQ